MVLKDFFHLFPLLKNSPDARVVTLSSGAATLTDGIDFENLKLEKPYNEWQSYAVSKLADILFTYELDRKIKAVGLNILSVAAGPAHYVSHTGSKPMSIQWKLEEPIPEYLWTASAKMVVG